MIFQLKGRVAVSLQALAEVLPSYSDKDFHVVARQNNKGKWCSELWTKRSFEPLEIQLGPWSSQLKDSHLMHSLHALAGIPKHGAGAHPDNLVMALGGRGKNQIAPKGEMDSAEHQGSLFWVVGRSSKHLIAIWSWRTSASRSGCRHPCQHPKSAEQGPALSIPP